MTTDRPFRPNAPIMFFETFPGLEIKCPAGLKIDLMPNAEWREVFNNAMAEVRQRPAVFVDCDDPECGCSWYEDPFDPTTTNDVTIDDWHLNASKAQCLANAAFPSQAHASQ